MKSWFNGDNKDSKSKPKLTVKKGMLGDEFSKAEKLGKQLRYREEDFEEEKEAESWIEEVRKELPVQTEQLKAQLGSSFLVKRGQGVEEPKVNEEVKKINVQLTSPFPPRRGNDGEVTKVTEEPKKPTVQKSSPFPPRKVTTEEIKVEEEAKKPTIQLTSPFPIRREGDGGAKVVDTPKKPTVQLTSPFPPRKVSTEETKEVEAPKKLTVQLTSPFPPKKADVERDEQAVTKQEEAWEPIAPWMQSIATRSDVIDRSDIQVNTPKSSTKISLRDLAKDIIKNKPKETIIDLSKEEVSEDRIEESGDVFEEENNKVGDVVYTEVESVEEVEILVEDEAGINQFAQEVAYSMDDSFAVEEDYEETDYTDVNDYGFPEDPLGLNQMFDLGSAVTTDVAISDQHIIGSEDAMIEAFEEEVAATQAYEILQEHPIVEEQLALEEESVWEEQPVLEEQLTMQEEVVMQEEATSVSQAWDIRASVHIDFDEEHIVDMNESIGKLIISLNTVGEKYDFSITKNETGGQSIYITSAPAGISEAMSSVAQVTASVSIHFDQTHIDQLNGHIGQVIISLNSAGEKYDFSITKDEQGGQSLNITSKAEVISKVMALFK